jgi:hypothetical protein
MGKNIIIAAILLLSSVALVVSGSKECRFAPTFNRDEIMDKVEVREEFLSKIIAAEAKFIRKLGVDHVTGLTVGKVPVNQRTGMPMKEKR